MATEVNNTSPTSGDSMAFASWNLHGGLSDPERAHAIADTLTRTQADIIVLPDAWHEDTDKSVSSGRRLVVTAKDFAQNGYVLLHENLRESRPDDDYANYHFAMLVKDSLPHSAEVLQLDTRPAIRVDAPIGRTALCFIGLYLNDQGNASRGRQIAALTPFLDEMRGQPTVLGGDFNNMYADSRPSRLLQYQLARKYLGMITLANNALPRLIEIAEGESLEELEAQGFADADENHLPTVPSRLPLFQLDRFMHRDLQPAGLIIEGVQRTRIPRLSDHQMIETRVNAA